MAALAATHETRTMLEGIDRWENEGGRYPSQAPTGIPPRGMRVFGLDRTRSAAAQVAGATTPQLLASSGDATPSTFGVAERPQARRQP
jgi:hypothetical protein